MLHLSRWQQADYNHDAMTLEMLIIVALRWPATPRRIAVALYAFRLAGFVAFAFTGQRALLVLFPNLFEFWFLFVAAMLHWRPGFAYTRSYIAAALAVLLPLKLSQEYAVHGARWLEGFTAFETVEAIWDWATAWLS